MKSLLNSFEDFLSNASTMCEVFQKRIELSGDNPWLTLYEGDRIKRRISFAEFSGDVGRWVSLLSEKGLKVGDRALIVLPTEEAFFASYWAVSVMGAVPVPAYPPIRLSRLEEYQLNLAGLAKNCGAEVLITNAKVAPLLAGAEKLVARRLVQALPSQLGAPSSPAIADVSERALALLQYTSGSTGNQKGVMLSHANLIANIRAIGEKIGINPKDVAVSWLPLYHDMGLIGLMLGSFYWGIELIAMSPIDFLRKPVRWLKVMSNHKATLTAAPNFAFNLTARKVKSADLEGLDLTSCRMALCGAEPIYPSTIKNFSTIFSQAGFRPGAFFPAYGLAENTLAAAFSNVGEPPLLLDVDAEKLENLGIASSPAPGALVKTMVSVGKPLTGMELKIAAEDNSFLPEGVRGEVAVRGTSVMSGYYSAPEATSGAIVNGWLHTGDLGFILDGRLYVCGRKKDMIIKGGRNFFAEDIEAAAMAPGVKPGGICAFGLDDPDRGTEQVILVVEVRPDAEEKDLRELLRKQVAEETGCRPDKVILVPVATLPKTSSGKIQRFKAREWHLDGSLAGRGGEKRTIGFLTYAAAWMRNKIPFLRR